MNIKNHKGLGDTVEAIAKATKLDVVANKVAELAGKEDCGCGRRKEALNRAIPYGTKTPGIKPPKEK
jgi:hypothetical protein